MPHKEFKLKDKTYIRKINKTGIICTGCAFDKEGKGTGCTSSGLQLGVFKPTKGVLACCCSPSSTNKDYIFELKNK